MGFHCCLSENRIGFPFFCAVLQHVAFALRERVASSDWARVGTSSAVWILCVDSARYGTKKPPRKGAKSFALLEWAWVELNYRPHAYQASSSNMNSAQKFFLAWLSGTTCSALTAFKNTLRNLKNILRT